MIMEFTTDEVEILIQAIDGFVSEYDGAVPPEVITRVTVIQERLLAVLGKVLLHD